MEDEHKIILLVDDKQELLEFLQAGQRDAEQYAQFCFQILDQWGADPEEIDRSGFTDSVSGYLINCAITGKQPMLPGQFVSERLASYSNYGLRKCGLSRAQYDKMLQERKSQ